MSVNRKQGTQLTYSFPIFSHLSFQSAFQYYSKQDSTQTSTRTQTPTHTQLFVHHIFAQADYPEKEGWKENEVKSIVEAGIIHPSCTACFTYCVIAKKNDSIHCSVYCSVLRNPAYCYVTITAAISLL